jgi:parvulin-like peptidyl-prolyl isomerase
MDEYVSEFGNVILTLKTDEISKPFKTNFGYHIAQLIAAKDGIYTTRHILLRVD